MELVSCDKNQSLYICSCVMCRCSVQHSCTHVEVKSIIHTIYSIYLGSVLAQQPALVLSKINTKIESTFTRRKDDESIILSLRSLLRCAALPLLPIAFSSVELCKYIYIYVVCPPHCSVPCSCISNLNLEQRKVNNRSELKLRNHHHVANDEDDVLPSLLWTSAAYNVRFAKVRVYVLCLENFPI